MDGAELDGSLIWVVLAKLSVDFFKPLFRHCAPPRAKKHTTMKFLIKKGCMNRGRNCWGVVWCEMGRGEGMGFVGRWGLTILVVRFDPKKASILMILIH